MLILASASPRRKEILTMLNLKFETRPANADETFTKSLPPEEIVMTLAKKKANAVSFSQNDIVLGADTIVYINGRILNKPEDEKDAINMLKMLSNNTHEVFTGVCLHSLNEEICFYDRTFVTFTPLSDGDIFDYIKTKEPFDKAGAYGIQGRGCTLVKEIRGDFYNVMGLPAGKVFQNLKKNFNFLL